MIRRFYNFYHFQCRFYLFTIVLPFEGPCRFLPFAHFTIFALPIFPILAILNILGRPAGFAVLPFYRFSAATCFTILAALVGYLTLMGIPAGRSILWGGYPPITVRYTARGISYRSDGPPLLGMPTRIGSLQTRYQPLKSYIHRGEYHSVWIPPLIGAKSANGGNATDYHRSIISTFNRYIYRAKYRTPLVSATQRWTQSMRRAGRSQERIGRHVFAISDHPTGFTGSTILAGPADLLFYHLSNIGMIMDFCDRKTDGRSPNRTLYRRSIASIVGRLNQ